MHVESAKNAESMKRGKGHKIIGISLSAMGLFWLARKAGWMAHDTSWAPHHANGSIFWPLVVIALGLFLLFSIGRGKKQSE